MEDEGLVADIVNEKGEDEVWTEYEKFTLDDSVYSSLATYGTSIKADLGKSKPEEAMTLLKQPQRKANFTKMADSFLDRFRDVVSPADAAWSFDKREGAPWTVLLSCTIK